MLCGTLQWEFQCYRADAVTSGVEEETRLWLETAVSLMLKVILQ